MTKISVLDILYDTTVDGPGFRTSIYAAGCIHKCLECHNPQSWDYANGQEYSIEELLDIVSVSEFANVTFTGGDPLIQVNEFTELAKKIKTFTHKNIWCYTGFTFEQINKSQKLSQILPFIDVLVDGKYMNNLYNEDLPFRGSSNQRIIDVPKTLQTEEIILKEDFFI
ncbi:anaerobic ribonucleoside-triphosphate reductase activating protein [Apibacter sp.]|uniref:anaerobic ribonucleoside-triphosphate reductase activating protein n=1 Tax=Apibacter sp. TaxID=2023709 RepID=UPI0025F51559|nr:anaerobic ribonucleoside-triphosphate reductase activating protein [Apibacter sp.]MCT6869209.1 anaerobic ribonucleoside-triphosphate reductase activating protein [Apibacter sp.]